MARPHYLTLSNGQMSVWRSGEGRAVVVLPSPVEHAGDAADRVAAAARDVCATAIEWPGIGGSAGLRVQKLPDLSEMISEALARLSLSDAPIIAFDLAAGIGAQLGKPMSIVDGTAAAQWVRRNLAPPDLAIRDDGTHLTALWAFMRNARLVRADDPNRADRDGDALPSADMLDRAVVAASVRPEAFGKLWSLLAAGFVAQAARLSAASTSTDLATALTSVSRAGRWADIPPTARFGDLWCDYADTPSARVHLRRSGDADRPLMVLQSAPGSTEPLSDVIRGLASVRRVIAPDFPGNGDSGKPLGPVDIPRIGAMMLEVADALALPTMDLWGTHTGALVALEMALQAPQRIGRVILEAPPILAADFSQDILAHYLPKLIPDRWGLHLQQAWNMRRDMFIFWPWYRESRDAIRPLGLPDLAMLHQWTIGLLKSGTTYDLSYRAAFEYPTAERLAKTTRPTLLTAGPTDMLVEALQRTAELGNSMIRATATPATVWYPNQGQAERLATLQIYSDFLDSEA